MLPVPFSRRCVLIMAVGPDAIGSKPGIECVQMPEKSGMDAEFCRCPKTGVAAADTNINSRRKFRCRVFMLSSPSWFRQYVLSDATPCARGLEGQWNIGVRHLPSVLKSNNRCARVSDAIF